MALLAAALTALNASSSGQAMITYEHYVDYAIGMLLMFFGGYFLINASVYFDANWKPKQSLCACHAHIDKHDEYQHLIPQAVQDEMTSMPIPQSKIDGNGIRTFGSTLIGFVQGVACPAGLVGVALLKQYGPVEKCMFIVVFLVVAMLTMGFLAMAYGTLTRDFVSSAALARGIYYVSCSLSFALGLVWIILNATTGLEVLFGAHHHIHRDVHHSAHHKDASMGFSSAWH